MAVLLQQKRQYTDRNPATPGNSEGRKTLKKHETYEGMLHTQI